MNEQIEQPHIQIKGNKYYMIGCKKCDRINQTWSIFTDGNRFIAKCIGCGNLSEIKPTNLKDEPDFKKEV